MSDGETYQKPPHSADMAETTIDIQPSPRILSVLGDIEFQEWQCIAELVDNSFDDFLEIERSGLAWDDELRVDVRVPTAATPLKDAVVEVIDTGRGMTLDALNDAVRAGWSSNDRFTKLGLFGIGFNIATARLGTVARLLTTKDGDDEWIGVEIDLRAIGESQEFRAPIIREPKARPTDHGTRVIVGELKPNHMAWLQRNHAQLRKVLGDVYAYLLEHRRFRLLVNDVAVEPRRACRWAPERSVTRGTGKAAEKIPAVLEIDEPLPAMETCLRCHNWQEPGLGECVECGQGGLEARERRIHGWLGIQRYLHKTDFGIAFLRNGRKILRADKRVFEWQNPNDPLSAVEVEYPTELGQGGRIIGEIHLDHVPVNYQKNAFEYGDKSWIGAVHSLRGHQPLLPRKAKQLGYSPNDSPLARLHRGYRRNDPGLDYLVPGNGTGPIHDEARLWGQEFHRGVPEYQSDERWYEAARLHDERKREAKEAKAGVDSETGRGLGELGLAPPGEFRDEDPAQSNGSKDPAKKLTSGLLGDPATETETERLQRYRAHSELLPELTGTFGVVELGASIKLETFLVAGQPLVDGQNQPAPVLLVPQPGNVFAAYVDGDHEVFSHFSIEPAELVLAELANQLKVRVDSDLPLTQILALLVQQHLPDHRVDVAVLGGQARELMTEIRERMIERIGENPDRAWQFLTPDERSATENHIVAEGGSITIEDARKTGDFLAYAPPTFIPRLLEEWPEAFMDGKLFSGLYAGLSSTAGKRLSMGRLISYVYDVALLADAQSKPRKDELLRARLSISLLQRELVVDAAPAAA
jgi:hypothetical protein